jgi:hypothetical protein
MVDILTGQVEDREPTPEEQRKNPAAVARGKLGGVKGGSARAAKMTAKQRSDSARNAANEKISDLLRDIADLEDDIDRYCRFTLEETSSGWDLAAWNKPERCDSKSGSTRRFALVSFLSRWRKVASA